MRCVSSICVFKFSAMFPDNQMLSGGGGGGEQAGSSLLSQTINYYISPKSKVFGDFLTIFKVSNLGENNLI